MTSRTDLQRLLPVELCRRSLAIYRLRSSMPGHSDGLKVSYWTFCRHWDYYLPNSRQLRSRLFRTLATYVLDQSAAVTNHLDGMSSTSSTRPTAPFNPGISTLS